MANRYQTAVLFAMEKNPVLLFARLTFGAAGAVTLDTNNSKGFCNAAIGTVAFTGTTANASPTVTAVNTFAGLYPGMSIKDAGPTNVNSTISSMNAGAATITMAGNATGVNTGLIASGGRYVLQLGSQAGVRLDSYNKILMLQHSWDESGTAAAGAAGVLALAPGAPSAIIVGNQTSIRTVPATATSNSTDCTLTLQFGSGIGTAFTAYTPNNGDVLRIALFMGNCTAP